MCWNHDSLASNLSLYVQLNFCSCWSAPLLLRARGIVCVANWIGSRVPKASTVGSQSIPLMDTFNWHLYLCVLNRHYGWYLTNNQPTSYASIKNKLIFNQDVGVLIKCQVRCYWNVDWVSIECQSRINQDINGQQTTVLYLLLFLASYQESSICEPCRFPALKRENSHYWQLIIFLLWPISSRAHSCLVIFLQFFFFVYQVCCKRECQITFFHRTAQSVGCSFTSFGELTWSKGGKKLLIY